MTTSARFTRWGCPMAANPKVVSLHGPTNPDWWLDKALNNQSDVLFNAQAIVAATAAGLERHFGGQMDSIDHPAPNYARALMEAVRMIDRACGNLEMMCLRPIAEGLQKENEEVDDD